MDYALFVAGLATLLWSGDRLVASAAAIARSVGMSPLVIGVVVVGLGTSLPELFASVDAAIRNSPGLAIGNVVGSNIANILVVLGLSALFVPVKCRPEDMRRDLPGLLAACLLVLVASQQEIIGRGMGLLLTAGLVAYLVLLLRRPRGVVPEETVSTEPGQTRLAVSAAWAAVSLVLLVAGAHWLISGALGIAERHGLSDSLVGLTLVAVGTSLPELAVAAAAIIRRHADIAIGNIIGSTLFNLLGVLGITALVRPLAVPLEVATFDIWVMTLAVLALALFARTGWRISRGESALLLLGYPVYLTLLTR